MSVRYIDAVWVRPPVALPLEGDDVHVWLAPLDLSPAALRLLEATLSRDERERADRFYFERDRRRFVCARGVLRNLLADYQDDDPAMLTFRYGSHGKPELDMGCGRPIAFNVSHSGELALLAFSRRGDVGVDVEQFRYMSDRDDIACRFFARGEVARLRALPLVEHEAAFFRCWTRKEAYVKAVGDGLARPLDAFEVTFASDEPGRLTIRADERESRRWALRGLEVAPRYAAALVTEGRRHVSCWRWTDARIPIVDYAREAV